MGTLAPEQYKETFFRDSGGRRAAVPALEVQAGAGAGVWLGPYGLAALAGQIDWLIGTPRPGRQAIKMSFRTKEMNKRQPKPKTGE